MSSHSNTPHTRPEKHKMGDKYIPTSSGTSQSLNSCDGNSTNHDDNLESVNSNPKVSTGSNWKTKKSRQETVKLNHPSINKLRSPEGVEFLQKLSNDNKVKVTVIPQTQNKKFEFACIITGGQNRGNRLVKNSIRTYCQDLLQDATLEEAQSIDLMETFQGLPFNLDVLETSLIHLENPNVNWVKHTVALHKKIKQTWGRYFAGKSEELSDLLKKQYIALHAVLFGKLDIEDAVHHRNILKQAVKDRCEDEMVRNSYNYIFVSSGRLDNISYHSVIKELPPHIALKDEIDALRASANEICAKNGLQMNINSAYNNLLHCHYSERKVFQFKKIYDEIKAKDVQC